MDERTVELTLEKPFAPFLHLMAYDAASIVPREEVLRLGTAFANRPVGTGAFRLKEWRRDDRVVLEAFPEHFRGAPVSDIPTGHCRSVKADPRSCRGSSRDA